MKRLLNIVRDVAMELIEKWTTLFFKKLEESETGKALVATCGRKEIEIVFLESVIEWCNKKLDSLKR